MFRTGPVSLTGVLFQSLGGKLLVARVEPTCGTRQIGNNKDGADGNDALDLSVHELSNILNIDTHSGGALDDEQPSPWLYPKHAGKSPHDASCN